MAAQQAALRRKLQGHYAYYGITGNMRAVARFHLEARRLWRKWLLRRSWRTRLPWAQIVLLTERYPHRALCIAFIVAQRIHIRGAGCPNRARLDLWEPRAGNCPRRPGHYRMQGSLCRTKNGKSLTWWTRKNKGTAHLLPKKSQWTAHISGNFTSTRDCTSFPPSICASRNSSLTR